MMNQSGAESSQALSGAEMHMQGRESVSNSRMLTKDIAVEIRMGFVRKVYGILSMQLLLTVLIAGAVMSQGRMWAIDNSWIIYLCSFTTMALMCAMICAQNIMRKFPTNYILLLLFTASEAVLIGVICSSYSVETVVASVAVTVAIFVTMSLYACFTKTDFTGMQPFFFALIMCFFMFGLMLMILRLCGVYSPFLYAVYNLMGVIIFTFYIVFDTQRILGEYGGHKTQFSIDDYCFASLTLYLDIINLFLYLLALFGNRR